MLKIDIVVLDIILCGIKFRIINQTQVKPSVKIG